MKLGEWHVNMAERMMKKLRMEEKLRENEGKPQLSSPDVVYTGDFVFSKIKPLNRIGDSGSLLLSKRKSTRSEQYLVKHAYSDCASNEFVYSKIAKAMGYKMPNMVLFAISPEEKRNYFKTEYIIGAKYLDITNHAPSYSVIREHATNWKDYFSFRTLYLMTGEEDSFETPLVNDGFIYRVDTTNAFPISNFMLDTAGINVEINGIMPKTYWKEYFLNYAFDHLWDIKYFDQKIDDYTQEYGKECIAPLLEPFERIQDISAEYIDDFLNTLCYFYPDFVGGFFKNYLAALQRFSKEYLKTIVN